MKITTEKVKRERESKGESIKLCLTPTVENKLHFSFCFVLFCFCFVFFAPKLEAAALASDTSLTSFCTRYRKQFVEKRPSLLIQLITLGGMEGDTTGRLNPKWVRFELTDYQNWSEL